MAFMVDGDLERLQGLHHDLVALYETKVPVINRLLQELETRAKEFQDLLDKKARNEESLQKLLSGTLIIDDEQFSINDDYKNCVLQIAEELNLDELQAAELYYRSETQAATFDRSATHASILLFHTRRQFLLDCVRLCLHGAASQDEESETTDHMREVVELILHQGTAPISGSTYWRKCLSSMADIETWLRRIADRLTAFSVTNPGITNDVVEIMEMQQKSLMLQHEALASIMTDLTILNYTKVDDLHHMVPRLRKLDRLDLITAHYTACLASLVHQFAHNDSACSLEEARTLNAMITSTKDSDTWSMRNLQATASMLWLADYQGRFLDNPTLQAQPSMDGDADVETLAPQFMDTLKDGAFQLLLILSRELKRDDWFDPARHALTDFLTRESSAVVIETLSAQPFFRRTLMERFQRFAESLITNLPSTLKRLKADEDEQRRLLYNQVQTRNAEESLHLERFFIIISYAFEGFPEASEAFWLEPESNFSGFLQWASQRLTTPRAAAFCCMFIALTDGEECARPAHRFLLADSVQAPARLRRNSPLSWHHIFAELNFYAGRIIDRPLPQLSITQEEAESPMMLESYLRLTSHLALNCAETRNWLVSNNDHHVAEDLLWMCQIHSEVRLRACAFNTLTSILTDKDVDRRDALWSAIDESVCGRFSASNRAPIMQSSPASAEEEFFKSLLVAFELPAAFVKLLRTLIEPCANEDLLHDSLPFPESLGAAYRLSGVDAYVDFVMNRVFVGQIGDLTDPTQLRILRLECLTFITSCLRSFNENLVVFANTTKVNVDTAMQTSNIANYVKLHPFARVMEWLYNDNVIKSLFEAARQDATEVNMASADSPLVLSVLQSIETIILILTLQSTYMNAVRPVVKIESSNRRPNVANSALASFEDAILNNLSFVSALGLYCGSGHQHLVEVSLQLMKRLSASRKLNMPIALARGQKLEKSRLLTSLEAENEADSISRSLIIELRVDERECEQLGNTPGWAIKFRLLEFLNECIGNAPDRPTVAHLLLGFSCGSKDLDVATDSLLDNGCALIHAVIAFLRDCPGAGPSGFNAKFLDAKREAIQLLQKLWRSPMSSRIALQELRSSDFFFAQMLRENVVRPDSIWEERLMTDGDFFLTESSDAYASFLTLRSVLLEYAATECKAVQEMGATSLLERIKSTLFGATVLPDGDREGNPSMTDLLDFLELEPAEEIPLPESAFFNPADFAICKPANTDEYDLGWVQQLLMLRQNEVRMQQTLSTTESDNLSADAGNFWACIIANNRLSRIRRARQAALKSWTQLVVVMLTTCQFDAAQKGAFVLQLLQLILPRLEVAIQSDQSSALVLAQLVKTLLQHVGPAGSSGDSSAASDAVNERLSHLFRVAISGIQEIQARSSLRQVCSEICHGFLSRLLNKGEAHLQRRQALHTIKTGGSRLIENLCDDAYNGEGTTQLSSLLVLTSCVILANKQGSKVMIDGLARINFIHIIIDGLRNVPAELQSADCDEDALITYQETALSLLLCLSQTRYGAAQVLNAGLFQAIRDSELFTVDPDIGLDIASPSTLTTYFRLLLASLRIITAVVLSSGVENEQTVAAARNFLQDYRLTMVSIFKRSARIGTSDKTAVNEQLLGDLVDTFTILISASGFLDGEDNKDIQAKGPRLFS